MRVGKFTASQEFLDQAANCGVYQSKFSELKRILQADGRFLVVAESSLFEDMRGSQEEMPLYSVYNEYKLGTGLIYKADRLQV